MKEKKVISVLFLAVIFLPIFLTCLAKITGRPFRERLDGYFDKVSRPHFSGGQYLSGTFQAEFEKWLNSSIRPREHYIRLYNQIQYSLFRLSKDIVGKHDNILGLGYIAAECGTDKNCDFSIPENHEKLADYVRRLASVQQKLSSAGKHFLFFITPSKATQFYDDIPLKYRIQRRADYRPPYHYLKELLEASGVRYLDSRDFVSTDGAPDFYATGIHWARPIEQRMSRAIVETMAEMSGRDLPRIDLGELRSSPAPYWRDADLFNLANIIAKPHGTYYEYEARIAETERSALPRYLVQGGSFAEGLFFKDYEKFIEKSYSFFYRQVLRSGRNNQKISNWDDVDFSALLDQVDFVLIEVNEAAISSFSNGYVEYLDNFLDTYIPGKTVEGE